MKKLLLMLFLTATLSAPVVAQQITYACQYIETAGLNWEKGAWKTTSFKLRKPFFLTAVNGSLTLESVGKVTRTTDSVFCHPKDVFKNQTCADELGGSLIFNHKNELGGVAQLFGSVNEDLPIDTLSVAAFTCTKM